MRTVYHYQKTGSNFMILKVEVMPSQRLNDNPHMPWVAINLKGTSVEMAHCTCMAGLGESCSHIGALLFKLKAAIRVALQRKLVLMLLAHGINTLCPERVNQEQSHFQELIQTRKRKILTCFC